MQGRQSVAWSVIRMEEASPQTRAAPLDAMRCHQGAAAHIAQRQQHLVRKRGASMELRLHIKQWSALP